MTSGSPQLMVKPPLGTMALPVTISVGLLPVPGIASTHAAQLLESRIGQAPVVTGMETGAGAQAQVSRIGRKVAGRMTDECVRPVQVPWPFLFGVK